MKPKMNISEFKKFQKVMQEQLGEICERVVNDGEYSLLTISKKLDGIVYQYTGKEELICDTDENNKKKILFVKDLIDSFNENESQINVKVEDARKNNKVHKKFFIHLLPSLTDGDIHRKDVLLMMFSSVLINHIWKENPKAFEWSLGDLEEDFVDDSDV